MKNKNVSLFISFNGDRGFFKEVHLSATQIKLGVAGLLLLSLALLSTSLGYVFSSPFQEKRYKQENVQLKAQLAKTGQEMARLNSRLSQIEDFSRKIKVIAGVDSPSALAMGPLSSADFPHISQNRFQQRGPASLHTDHTLATNPAIGSLEPAKANALGPDTTNTASTYPLSISPERGDFIRVYMDRLTEKSKMVQQDITKLMEHIYEKKDIIASTPSIMPAQGWISSHFGYRQYPFTGQVSLHEGMDIAGVPGSPVKAPSNGVVVFAGYKPGYGKVIIVDHGYELSTLYGHLSDIMVSQKQKVTRGQIMGAIGNTGNSSGPHLHYEVRISNVPVDPRNYILNKGGLL